MQQNAKFLMSRAAVQAIKMLKDEKSGRYLWSRASMRKYHYALKRVGGDIVNFDVIKLLSL